MRPRTAWQALTQRPLRFLGSAWPWRSLAYLCSGVLLGVAVATALALIVATGVLLLIVLVGFAAILAVMLSGIVVARFERWRLRLVDLDPAPDPHRAPERPGVRAWLETRLREPATWRELAFTGLSLGGLWWMDLGVLACTLLLPVLVLLSPFFDPEVWALGLLGLALLLPAPYTITAWAGARAAFTRAILAPRDDELGSQLHEVRRSRARLVDAFELERRTIERDLHDGAQQRLVSLSVQLGLARLDAEPGSDLDRQLLAAQEQVTLTLAELRALIRGIHPQVLTDHGLPAAVTELATLASLPVEVDIMLPRRPPPAVEVTAYYVVAEALANIAKHSGARTARVHVRLHTDLLVLEIRDDGTGGADPDTGTGLVGLADRLAVVDGRMRLSSPPGGPTLLHVEVPCHA